MKQWWAVVDESGEIMIDGYGQALIFASVADATDTSEPGRGEDVIEVTVNEGWKP